MFGIIGIVLIFGMVFGGYLLAGGKMGIILKALPFEFMMIGGAAVGVSGRGDSGYLSGNGLLSAVVLGRIAGEDWPDPQKDLDLGKVSGDL